MSSRHRSFNLNFTTIVALHAGRMRRTRVPMPGDCIWPSVMPDGYAGRDIPEENSSCLPEVSAGVLPPVERITEGSRKINDLQP